MRRVHQRHQPSHPRRFAGDSLVGPRRDPWVQVIRGETVRITPSPDPERRTADGLAVSSRGKRFVRSLAVAVGTAVLAVLSIVLTLDEADASSVTKAARTGSAAATACSATPVPFEGRTYCPGYVIGVKSGVYGTGTRVVLRGVTVDGVTAIAIVVTGGPSCLPDPTRPPVWCGATVPSLVVPARSLAGRPRSGDVIDLYGITDGVTLQPVRYRVIGYCDPLFGC